MLAEISEPDAAGEVAVIYERIRRALRIPVVNFVWRHLATIDGGLSWGWPIIEVARNRIDQTVPHIRTDADRLVTLHGLRGRAPAIEPAPAALNVIAAYDRGNCWNMLSMSVLAAARAGQALDCSSERDHTPRDEPAIAATPAFPRYQDLAPDTQRSIDRLAAAGPAAVSGVRPSLWVHLASWPDRLTEIAEAYSRVLGSADFEAAHTAFLSRAPELLGLQAPVPTVIAAANEHPIDRAIRLFRLRIAEMVLIGRVLKHDLGTELPRPPGP